MYKTLQQLNNLQALMYLLDFLLANITGSSLKEFFQQAEVLCDIANHKNREGYPQWRLAFCG